MKTEDYKKVIQDFANKHKLIFEDEGECGFGRECVGLTSGSNWVEYNPCDSINYNRIEDFYCEEFYDITPEDAYHKHECLAVLGRGPEAIKQLGEWVTSLNEIGVTIETFNTGATGMQAMISGVTGRAIKKL